MLIQTARRAAVLMLACAGPLFATSALAADPPPPAPAKPAFPNQTHAPPPAKPSAIKVEVVAHGLDHPWAVAFLPGGDMLVTLRKGELRRVGRDGTISAPLAGLPPIRAVGVKGLLDVELDPGFARNRVLYLTYFAPNPAHADQSPQAYAKWLLEPNRDADKAGFETVAKARLSADGAGLEDFKVILQAPSMGARRIAVAKDGKLFISADAPVSGNLKSGDEPQKLDNLYGKVLRINADGSVPQDNPFVGKAGVRPQIWAYGFRDPEGIAIDRSTGALWTVENAQNGGDELNRIEKGRNYGFPAISYGLDAGNVPFGDGTGQAPGMEQPVYYWSTGKPFSLAAVAIYDGKADRAWRGDIFTAGLAAKTVFHLALKDGKVVSEEPMLTDRGKRIRDVREGPDGAIWVLTDETDGELLKITPQR